MNAVTLTEDVTLTAALPRKGAGHGFTAATTPSPSDARVLQTALVAWEDMEDLWRSLRPVQVHALDSHHATLSVTEGSARLPKRDPRFPDDVVAAFSLEARRA